MKEFFICANSFAAPFVSDESTHFVEADSAEKALEKFAAEYDHPCGLFSAQAYQNADAFHKNKKPLAQWLCNHEIAKEKATKGKGAYVFMSRSPGEFEIDGKVIKVKDPKKGRVITWAKS
jgi:hypothetical protein